MALVTLIGAKVEAADYVRLSTVATALGTTMSSEKISDFFTPAREDALAFIGSDGELSTPTKK